MVFSTKTKLVRHFVVCFISGNCSVLYSRNELGYFFRWTILTFQYILLSNRNVNLGIIIIKTVSFVV